MCILNCELQQLNYIVRKSVSECNDLDYDFTDWCEGASSLMWYLVKEKYNIDTKDNYIALGTFKNKGHYWNVINGIIIDTTIDQFGKLKTGIISAKSTKNYKQKSTLLTDIEDIKSLMSEEIDYIGLYNLNMGGKYDW